MSFRTEAIEVGTTAPTFPEIDDVWVDTSGDVPALRVYDGHRWEEIGASTIPTYALGIVNHGTDAAAVRPAGYAGILWRGSVEPVNMLTDVDLWVELP